MDGKQKYLKYKKKYIYLKKIYHLLGGLPPESSVKKPIYTIKMVGGLCNYLRVMFSYREYAKLNNLHLNVIWLKTHACHGHFCDYFQPLNDVNILYEDNKSLKLDYEGYQWHPNFSPYENPKIYKDLKLLPHLKNLVDEKIKLLKDCNKEYVSIHVRRTDHYAHTPDNDFFEFLDKFKNSKNIYIATDNKNTYLKYQKKYPTLTKFDYHDILKSSFRKTSLFDAIIDIYICVYSKEFKGSKESSFSSLINHLRCITVR